MTSAPPPLRRAPPRIPRKTTQCTQSLTELRAALAAKECSAVGFAQLYLKRIEAARDLNAFVHVDADLTSRRPKPPMPSSRAARAVRSPACRSRTRMFVTRGWRSTAGSKMLANYESRSTRRRRPPAGGRHGHARQDQHGRVRDGPVEREFGVRRGEEPVGHERGAGRQLGRQLGRRGRASRRPRPAPTPAARSASPRRSRASPASSRPTAACRATG